MQYVGVIMCYVFNLLFQFTAEELTTRTVEMHDQHCRSLEGALRDHMSTAYGVSRNSILNSLKYFHVVGGKYVYLPIKCFCIA